MIFVKVLGIVVNAGIENFCGGAQLKFFFFFFLTNLLDI